MHEQITKKIVFRPLRRIKKTGKIAVASYMQWYGIATANYQKFELVIADDFRDFGHDEQVFDHEGEPLFFPKYDPYEMPQFSSNSLYSLTKHYEENIAFTYYNDGGLYGSPHVSYHGKGIDCMGTPLFTHYTVDQVAEHQKDVRIFDVLTVGVVLNWLGWFLMRLENANIKMKDTSRPTSL